MTDPDDAPELTDEQISAFAAVVQRDALRYRWLRAKYAKGEETYFAESCSLNEDAIDAEIDRLMALCPHGNDRRKIYCYQCETEAKP
jgi:hypothetical protein